MKNLYTFLLLYFCFIVVKAQVNVSTNFFDAAYKKRSVHDAWQVANDISPGYDGSRDEPQIRPDMKMNIIRLSGGIASGEVKNTSYDMVRWSNAANDYVYDFTRLLNVIDKADQHSDEIYQLVIDNVPWCFQRGYTFVDLGPSSFDGVHFRKFEEVEQYGNALPPSDMKEYGQYVEALMQTLVSKYGINRVKTWRFRVGSEIESPGHWKGTAKDFIDYLDVSIRAIRKIVPSAHVGVHTREPHYKAISSKGVNYKGGKFVSFYKEILEHCHANNLVINSWGLSYYIQFDKAGEFYTNETWYNEFVSALVNHPKWNKNTEINLEEFKATASFRGPDGSAVTLQTESTHGEVAVIALSNLFYKHTELNQIHRWLQYKNTTDGIANTELLSIVGKTRYESNVTGKPAFASNVIDAIFTKDEASATYEALLYNYNGNSTNYQTKQAVNVSFVTDYPVGTTFQYRNAYYTQAHNKFQSFVNEPNFQQSWYVDGITEGQKLGEAKRVLKPDIYANRYLPYNGHLKYAPSQWINITTVPRTDGSKIGSQIVITTDLESFSFRKFEFKTVAVALPVVLQFDAPVVGQRFSAPATIPVRVVEVNNQPVVEMRLYINNSLVRIIKNGPYAWGNNINTDPELFNLGAGTYNLRVTAKNSQGTVGERQMTIVVENPVTRDCNGVINGTAKIDACGVCSGGNTGITPSSPKIWYADSDGDGFGDASIKQAACTKPAGYVSVSGDLCTLDKNKQAPGECGCGIAEGTCNQQVPVVSFVQPLTGAKLKEGSSITVVVNATDSDGTIANVRLFINGTFVRQESQSPYEWNQTGQNDPLLKNLVAGTYTLRAVATDNNGNVAEKTITIVVEKIIVVSKEPILGADCASKNGSVNFELSNENRANATGYSWWVSGSASSVTSTNNTPYKTTIIFSQHFNGGEVCVGVNLSVAPYYISYCKNLTECVAPLSTNVMTIDATVYPNPTESKSVTVETTQDAGVILELKVLNSAGVVKYQSTTVQSGDALDLSNMEIGVYYLNIVCKNGVIVKKITLL